MQAPLFKTVEFEIDSRRRGYVFDEESMTLDPIKGLHQVLSDTVLRAQGPDAESAEQMTQVPPLPSPEQRRIKLGKGKPLCKAFGTKPDGEVIWIPPVAPGREDDPDPVLPMTPAKANRKRKSLWTPGASSTATTPTDSVRTPATSCGGSSIKQGGGKPFGSSSANPRRDTKSLFQKARYLLQATDPTPVKRRGAATKFGNLDEVLSSKRRNRETVQLIGFCFISNIFVIFCCF